LGFQW
jgi:hypothetical protein